MKLFAFPSFVFATGDFFASRLGRLSKIKRRFQIKKMQTFFLGFINTAGNVVVIL